MNVIINYYRAGRDTCGTVNEHDTKLVLHCDSQKEQVHEDEEQGHATAKD